MWGISASPAVDSRHDVHQVAARGVRRGAITCSVRIWMSPRVTLGIGEIVTGKATYVVST